MAGARCWMPERRVLRHRNFAVSVDLDRKDDRATRTGRAPCHLTIAFQIQIDLGAVGGLQARIRSIAVGDRQRDCCRRTGRVGAGGCRRVHQIHTAQRAHRCAIRRSERVGVAAREVVRGGIRVAGLGAQCLVQGDAVRRAHNRSRWRIVHKRQGPQIARREAARAQFERADIKGCVEFGVAVAYVVDQHAVVVCSGEVVDRVARGHASDCYEHLSRILIGQEMHIPGAVRAVGGEGVAHTGRIFPGGGAGERDRGDVDGRVIRITQPVNVVHTLFASVRVVERADLQRGTLGRLQLDDLKARFRGAQEGAELDVGFHVRFVLIQIGDGHAGAVVTQRHEGEVHAFIRVDHLVVRADGRHAAALAGVDGVAGGDAGAVRLIRRALAGNDDRRVAAYWRAVAEHQEQVLAGWRVLQREALQRIDEDAQVVAQRQDVVGVVGIQVVQRLVLHHPDLGGGRPDVCGRCVGRRDAIGLECVEVDGKNEVAVRIGNATRRARARQKNVVVARIGVEEDVTPVGGLDGIVGRCTVERHDPIGHGKAGEAHVLDLDRGIQSGNVHGQAIGVGGAVAAQ